MNDDLRQCDCGGEAAILAGRDHDGLGYVVVKCDKCDLQTADIYVSPSNPGQAKATAVSKWNRKVVLEERMKQ